MPHRVSVGDTRCKNNVVLNACQLATKTSAKLPCNTLTIYFYEKMDICAVVLLALFN